MLLHLAFIWQEEKYFYLRLLFPLTTHVATFLDKWSKKKKEKAY